MSALRYVLIGLAVLAALAVSIALVIRYSPSEPPQPARQDRVELPGPAAPKASAEMPAPADPPTAPPPAEAPQEPQDRTEQDSPRTLPVLPVPPASNLVTGPSWFVPKDPADQEESVPSKGEPAPAAGRLMLTEEQTERVRYVLLSHNVMQEEVENFPLRIGGTVPPNVPLTQLPIEIADVVPAYGRYSYVIVQNRIVIAVTNSRRIEVAIPF